MDIHGVVPPMVTPLTDDGDVDGPGLREYVRFLEDGGVHGLFPCGSTGEFASLTVEERTRVVETVVEAASVPVLAGCGDTSVRAVIDQVDAAADCGADAAVVVSPYYLPTTESSHSAFFERVADAAALPVFIYNIPELSGRGLAVDSVVALAEHDRIVGIKDTTGDLVRTRRLVERTPDDFHVFNGVGELFAPALDCGADGIIGGSICIMPGALSQLFEAHREGDRERVQRLVTEVLLPLIDAFADEAALSNIKCLVNAAGPDVGEPRSPLPAVDADRKRELRDTYRELTARYDEIREPTRSKSF